MNRYFKTSVYGIIGLVIIIASCFSAQTAYAAPAGSVDPTFISGSGFAGSGSCVIDIEIQSDGKIIAGCVFASYNGTPRTNIARLNADGSLDTSFDVGTGANAAVRGIAVQPDGKIIIAGDFTSYNGTVRNRIARLNADGTLDTSFDPGLGANDIIFHDALSLQPDGKIFIGGNFTSYGGTLVNRIARINIDGTLDKSFNPGTGADLLVHSLAVQSDGKVIITGQFGSVNGFFRPKIARFNTNGSLDTSFDPGIGANNTIQMASVQSDGKILVGGDFTSYNGTSINRLARLNPDGTLDTSFDPGAGANAQVTYAQSYSLLDDKILVAGQFTSFNGVATNRVVMLNPDGTRDTDFVIGSGFNGNTYVFAVQPDYKIIAGGFFSSYNGTSGNRIIRLGGIETDPPTVAAVAPADGETAVAVGADLSITFSEDVVVQTGSIEIYRSSDASLIEAIDISGSQVTGSGTDTLAIDLDDDLEYGTDYYVLIDAGSVVDQYDNPFAGITSSTDWNFTTEADVSVPVISNIAVAADATSAAITWDTNEVASTQVEYGLTSAYGSITTETDLSPRVTGHEVVLTGLQPDTTYHFMAISNDAAGNAGVSADTVFTTDSLPAQSSGGSTVSGTSFGCKDRNALNYDYFSKHVQSLCRYVPTVIQAPITNSSVDVSVLVGTVLRLGSRGLHVAVLQNALNARGASPALAADGVFGQKTFAAVKLFQSHNMLAVDGIVGPQTIGAFQN